MWTSCLSSILEFESTYNDDVSTFIWNIGSLGKETVFIDIGMLCAGETLRLSCPTLELNSLIISICLTNNSTQTTYLNCTVRSKIQWVLKRLRQFHVPSASHPYLGYSTTAQQLENSAVKPWYCNSSRFGF